MLLQTPTAWDTLDTLTESDWEEIERRESETIDMAWAYLRDEAPAMFTDCDEE